MGIDPDKDVEQLTFASYRSGKQGVKVVGVAQGQFAMAAVLKKMRLRKVKPIKLRNADIYPMPAGMQMTFLDESTLLLATAPPCAARWMRVTATPTPWTATPRSPT